MSTVSTESIAGRYELSGEVLAAGGMGTVVAARDRVLDRDVAIKLLAASLGDSPGARRRFRSEAIHAARLSHPNVVAVYDAGEHQGHPYIVMERLPGRTLADEIAAGPLPPERAREIFGQVLAALGSAHAAGLVHRDVKPHNVLIAEDRSARLSDFGIAKFLEQDATRTRDLMGTPAYVAPELLDGRPASAQSDLYAVGIMLFEALAGRKPFTGEPSVAQIAAVRAGSMPSLRDVVPWVDPELASVVDRATSLDPGDRFDSAEQMRSALRAVAEPDPAGHTPTRRLITPPPSPEAPTAAIRRLPERRRNPARRRVVAAVVATLAAGGMIAALATGERGTGVPAGPERGSAAPRQTVAPQAPGPLPTPLASALDRLDRTIVQP